LSHLSILTQTYIHTHTNCFSISFSSEIPDDVFKSICTLAYTCSAIEQANAEVRLKRVELVSLIGSIINSKRRSEGQPEINDTAFYERVEFENSTRQNLSSTDPREAWRILWMLYQTQERHYENWEKFCVEYGFARVAETEQEKIEHGNLVFFDTSRILQADEYAIIINGADERAGGRPSRAPTAEALPDSGEPFQKASDKCSVLQMVNFANEAFPPLIIYPSSAKTTVKVNAKRIQGSQQVKGQYGLDRPHYFDPFIAMTDSGGMKGDLFKMYFTEALMYYYPDAADTPGKRVLVKTDSGPGK
jgi:hypothetical protein